MCCMHPDTDTPVSILMPFKNAGATLDECLKSIQGQTFSDFELLAINDHSNDDSVKIINSYNDNRFRVLDNPETGIVSALNAGIEFSRAPFLARMDADDIMHPERLQKQLDCMQADPGISLCATQARLFPQSLIKTGYREYMHWQNQCLSEADIAAQIYVESPFAHPSIMVTRKAMLECGGYRDGDFAEDYDCWLRLYHAGKRMVKLDEQLLYWRESSSRLSRNCQRYRRQGFDQLRAKWLARDARLAERTIVYWGAGRKTRQRSRLLIENGYPVSAWIDIDNKKIGQQIWGASVHAPDWLETVANDNERPFVLVYVTNHGAREQCEGYLRRTGYRPGLDFLSVG